MLLPSDQGILEIKELRVFQSVRPPCITRMSSMMDKTSRHTKLRPPGGKKASTVLIRPHGHTSVLTHS